MGKMTAILPQGPNVHCDNHMPHEMHSNTMTTVLANAYCDGVTPLTPFYELMVRVPLSAFGDEILSHVEALQLLADMGLSCLVDEIGESAKTTLRVRGGDGVDRVYPLTSAVLNPENLGQGRLW